MINTMTDEPNKLSKTENKTHIHTKANSKKQAIITTTQIKINNEIQHQHHKVIKHIFIVTPHKVYLILLVVP
jgi:hypothetical protein